MGRIEASLKSVLWRSSSSPPSSLVPWRSHHQGQVRAPRESSSSFHELADVGDGKLQRRTRGSSRSFRELAGAGEVRADALAEVRRSRSAGQGASQVWPGKKGMSGMSGGGHPREEIRLQVGPASFIFSVAPAHPAGRVTRVGRPSLSVSVKKSRFSSGEKD
jgi:hypothetical protein